MDIKNAMGRFTGLFRAGMLSFVLVLGVSLTGCAADEPDMDDEADIEAVEPMETDSMEMMEDSTDMELDADMSIDMETEAADEAGN